MKHTLSTKKQSVKIEGVRSTDLKCARSRMALMGAIFVIAYILIAARAFDLSVINLKNKNTDLEYTEALPQKTFSPRANIVDRNGILLATSLQTNSLYADPKLIIHKEDIAQKLASILQNTSEEKILKSLQQPGRFSWIKRHLTPEEQSSILQIGDPGLGFKKEYVRYYPQEELASHIVGYTNIDGTGLSGLERYFDSKLTNSETDFVSTIDIRLQHILRRSLQEKLQHFRGIGATGAILDIQTGEILAAVSLPDFNPNTPASSEQNALFNRLTHGVYELGSTFKIFSTAALFETTDSEMGTIFDASKPLERGRFKISDYHAEDRKLTVPEVFMHSSNIGSALMGEMIGSEKLQQFYSDLGLFDKLPLTIHEVGSPLVPSPWRNINTLTASYGHGIAVSPLQMVVAAASIAGDGTLIRPRLVIDKDFKRLDSTKIQIVSTKTTHRMRQLLRLVATDGTGQKANASGYEVGGKTGTADKPSAHGYDRSRRISSFIGMFPMSSPRYAVFAMIDEPKGQKDSFGYATGGWVAAPIVGNVIASMGSLLGLEHKTTAETESLAAALQDYIHDIEFTEE